MNLKYSILALAFVATFLPCSILGNPSEDEVVDSNDYDQNTEVQEQEEQGEERKSETSAVDLIKNGIKIIRVGIDAANNALNEPNDIEVKGTRNQQKPPKKTRKPKTTERPRTTKRVRTTKRTTKKPRCRGRRCCG